MNTKALVRLLVGLVLAAIVMAILLPIIGIPRSQMLPPAMVYSGARGKASGVITKKYTHGTRNPFKVGERTYFLEYRFSAPAPKSLGVANPGQARVYTGSAPVAHSLYNQVKEGQRAPVRYETTYPAINGIAAAGAGRSVGAGSATMSGWLIYFFAWLVLGYVLSTVVANLMPRDD